MKSAIKNKRLYVEDFKSKNSDALYAFVPNWNLQLNPTRSTNGLLSVIEWNDTLHLCICLRSNNKYGHYLVFKGDFKSLGNYTNRLSIMKDWYLKKREFDQIKGYYVNQVLGTCVNKYFGQCINSTIEENYFTSKIEGPDIISLDSKMIESLFDSYKVYNVIYCVDNKLKRTNMEKESQNLIAVPLDQVPLDGTIHEVASFVYVPFECLRSISATMTKGSFMHYVLKHRVGKTFRRLVPNNSKPTRIKLVTEDQIKELAKVHNVIELDSFKFVSATEVGLIDDPGHLGTTVSIIKNNTKNIEASNIEVTFETVKEIHHVYGKGTSRKRCKHAGFCIYRGLRNTNRSHPGPFVDDENIKNHQYYQQTEQTDNLSQLYMEKFIDRIGKVAIQFLEREYSILQKVINNCCNKSILTSGSPLNFTKKDAINNVVKTKQNKKSSWLGFACSKHLDTCDSISGNKTLSQLFSDRCKSKYMETFYNTIGPGMPTTCIYLHVWYDELDFIRYKVKAYFNYNGLGISQPLFDGCGITFLGYAFTHESSLCYLEDMKGENVILKNNPDIFSMFAWGKSGGVPDASRGMRP